MEQANFVKNTLKVIVVQFVTTQRTKIVDEEGNDTEKLRHAREKVCMAVVSMILIVIKSAGRDSSTFYPYKIQNILD